MQAPPFEVSLRLTAFVMLSGLAGGLGDVRAASADILSEGRAIAFDVTRGNCLACHHIEGSESPGDLGPPLVALQSRFPDKGALRSQIWDPMTHNPGSRMPPFGRHRILTEDEIDKVVEYLYSL